MSFNSLLLGLPKKKAPQTVPELSHCSPGYRGSFIDEFVVYEPWQRFFSRASCGCKKSEAHWPKCNWNLQPSSTHLAQEWLTQSGTELLSPPRYLTVLNQTFKRLKSKLLSFNSSLSWNYLNSEEIKHLLFKDKFKTNF